jgi:ABC-2 type transport system permease protein
MASRPSTAARATTATRPHASGGAGFSPRRVVALSGRIVRQFLRDRRSLALLFVAPLLVMTILNLVIGNTASGVTLGIVAPDGALGDSVFSQIQSQLHEQSGLAVKRVARDHVDATLEAGDADGVLIFPADLQGAIQSGQTPQLTLRLEGSSPTVAKQLRGIVALLVRALGQELAAVGGSPGAGGGPGAGGFGAGGGTASGVTPTLATSYLYGGPQYTQTDALAPLFVGLFAFFFVFLLTSVSFLRERSQGTIERLMVSPLSKTELVLGYVGGFLVFALAQSVVILAYVIYVLQVHYKGNLGLLFLVTLALTVGGVNLGIFVSAFSRNELQVIQFIPLLLLPQALLGGLFWPVASLPVVLKQIAYVLPLTYANFALKDVMLKGFGLDRVWPELLVLVGFAVLMVVAAALSLRQDRV